MKIKTEFIDWQEKRCKSLVRFYVIAFLVASFILGVCIWARADNIDVQRLANAIYKAENSKTHPYGILAHYKHTTPRQACINTINHALRDWNGKGDFIAFLGSRYCPVNCDNDNGTNKYWVKNVRWYYANLR